ncbi:MAG TPA: protease HtpX [Gammaproteobacteria bacterium]
MKRVALFLMTNLAVILVLSLTTRLLGVDRFLTAQGLNLNMLLGFAAVIGFGGAFFSLAISKWMAKRSTGAQVIEQPRNATEQWLVETIRRQAQAAGIKMPEVAIYDSPDINAFATGPSRNNSLVAVSTGLLYAMSRDEAEAVLGHEVSHVANGDMVTLTLIQGVVNTFVIFLSRIIGYLVDSFLRRDEESSGPGLGYWISSIIAEIVLGILASVIVAWFSRQREFRADAGGANLAGSSKMVAALERLKQAHTPSALPNEMAAFGIRNGGVAKLFSSHPPLDERIAALRARAMR